MEQDLDLTPAAETQQAPENTALLISRTAIEETKQNISLMQDLVKHTLVREIDFGRIPGTPADCLWDPGASKILASFQCYAGHRRMINLDTSGDKISVCLEVPVIFRPTGQVVATGIGAASSLETKYKYRWVPDPREWGYDEDALKNFKTKQDRDKILYRIPNPEQSELLNTLVKIASKRAEVDAAESLPGVASVLREMFTQKKTREEHDKEDFDSPNKNRQSWDWNKFWGETRRMGLKDLEVHERLGVVHMKEWLDKGRTLEEALKTLREKFTSQVPEIDVNKWRSCVDFGWFNEIIQQKKINPATLLTFICARYKTEGLTLTEAMNNLTKNQADDLIKILNSRLPDAK